MRPIPTWLAATALLIASLTACSGSDSGDAAAPFPSSSTPTSTSTSTSTSTATDDLAAARTEVLATARKQIGQVLSYSTKSLGTELKRALPQLTDDYAKAYRTRFAKTIRPYAEKQDTTVDSRVTAAGITKIDPESASVLVFVRTTSAVTGQDKTVSPEALVVPFVHQGDRWLIDGIESGSAVEFDDPDPTRRAAADAAQEFTTTFDALDYRKLSGYFDDVTTMLTGRQLSTFKDSRKSLQRTYQQKKPQTTGKVLATGVASADPTGAVVLVSADVTNKADKSERQQRLKLTMKLVDGQWRVEQLTEL